MNIEIPPSDPVTKEEREKWLQKAEYGEVGAGRWLDTGGSNVII